jgi:phosphonate transport system ATP-binding protein
MLRFDKVAKRYPDGTVALDGVSLSIPRGQFCVVLGPSGAGKSTLLRLANGLTLPSSGRVFFEAREVHRRTMRAIRPRIAMVHQQFHLVPRLEVLANVLCGSLPAIPAWRAMTGLFPRSLQRRACRLLAEVGLEEKHLYRRAMELSGGQQQRVAIARAFLLSPYVVLADEPVASLDPATSTEILELLRRASRATGTTVLCSLHQVELATTFADRIVGLRAGRIAFDGEPSAIDGQALREIYEGAPDPDPAVER